MWQINWKARNSKSFDGEISERGEIVNKALFDFHDYENNLLPNISPTILVAWFNNRNITLT